MSGGYIHCADFDGDDKSGSPSFAVLKTVLNVSDSELSKSPLVKRLLGKTQHPSRWVALLRQFLKRGEVTIPSELAHELLPKVEAYYRELGDKLGHPEPGDAPELDAAAGLDPRKSKWGHGPGPGWHYYCAHDLVIALRKSVATSQPVTIDFD